MQHSRIILFVSKAELSQMIDASVLSALIKSGLIKAPVEKDLMNAKETASFLDIAAGTLYQMTSRKLIPFMKRGRKVYFSKKDLLQWLQHGKLTHPLDEKRKQDFSFKG